MRASEFINDTNEAMTPKPVSTSRLQKLQRQTQDLKKKQSEKLKDLNLRKAEARSEINRKRRVRAEKLRDSKTPENLADEMGELEREVRADEIGLSIPAN